MIGTLSIWEIVLVVLIVAVLFGGKKLPQLGKGLGEAITNFKNSLKKDSDKNSNGKDQKNSDNETDN